MLCIVFLSELMVKICSLILIFFFCKYLRVPVNIREY